MGRLLRGARVVEGLQDRSKLLFSAPCIVTGMFSQSMLIARGLISMYTSESA